MAALRLSSTSISLAVLGGSALALSLYVLHKLRRVEASISAAAAANNAALFQITQRIEVALGSSLKPSAPLQQQPQLAEPPAGAARSGRSNSLSSSGNLARVPSYEGSMSTATSEAAGYKTADEDPDDADAEPVQVSPPRKEAEGATGARGRPATDDANASSSSAEWGTHSVMAGVGGSWSCIDGAAGGGAEGSAGAGSSAPAMSAAEAAAAEEAEAKRAAEAAVVERADALYDEKEFQEVADLLGGSSEGGVEVVWRRCRALKEVAEAKKLKGEGEAAKRLLYEGFELVSAALERHPTHWACHKWYAILLSMTSGYEGTKATITKSVAVREHFEKAAELNPLDATSRHALGLWFWEVASLSWTMRKLAAAIFASPPAGTYDEALSHFQLAEGIEPGFYLRNRLMIAKCYQQLRDKAQAKKWAKAALELTVTNHDDETAAADAKQLLASL